MIKPKAVSRIRSFRVERPREKSFLFLVKPFVMRLPVILMHQLARHDDSEVGRNAAMRCIVQAVEFGKPQTQHRL